MAYHYDQKLKTSSNKIKKLIAGTAASIAILAGAAVPALADSSGNGSGYHPQGSACGQYHGAFGYFGKDNNLAGGADGQATGAANSAKGCQNNADTAPGLQP